MTEEIVALCKTMGASDSQRELLIPLIRAVTPALERRLKDGVTAADCGAAFPLAAAMVVMDGLERTCGSTGVTSFTAGDVSIHTGTVKTGGSSLVAQAERLMAPWMKESGFAVRGVRG